jgi:pimeloyl-ACP methyl ester carboxylesterase
MSIKVCGAFLIKIARRLCVAVFCVATFFVVTQDFQIFPLLVGKFFYTATSSPPPDVDVLKPISSDGTSVLVWRLRTLGNHPRVALIFHGNGEVVGSFLRVQRWLASQGITTYSMEFRGYNGSDSGWPSEQKLYEDARVSFELMLREEGIEAKDAIVLGSSIGTGFASHIAARYQTGALVLLSPYTSLPDVVAHRGVLKYLAPFLWYQFPSEQNVASLRSTCVVTAHGRRDTIIPFDHSERLKQAYTGDSTFTLLESDEAGHNDIIGAVQPLISKAIRSCFERTQRAATL